MHRKQQISALICITVWAALTSFAEGPAIPLPAELAMGGLHVRTVADGSWTLSTAALSRVLFQATAEVDLPSGTVDSRSYPEHNASVQSFEDETGKGHELRVLHTGLAGRPDLEWTCRLYEHHPWARVQLVVHNRTSSTQTILAIRSLRTLPHSGLWLGGPDRDDRVLSDSFSEDTPELRIRDLGDAEEGVHRGFGSQLIYNRSSKLSMLVAALSADRWLTVAHLRVSPGNSPEIASFDVEDTGTTEALRQQASATAYGPENVVPLQIEVPPGESLTSEPLMLAVGMDPHTLLENYGRTIRNLHHARVHHPTPMGWWSWTAYYYGVTEAALQTNAAWLAENLRPLGYNYFQIDEGYQFARGEYATVDRAAFPRGMELFSQQVREQGLTLGFWSAPFEVSDRSWVFQHHPEWLVHNLRGEPIHIGRMGQFDELYALDATHPGAQQYLRQTYATLTGPWKASFLKLDFMDASSVEGVRYRANTSALEALRIGLEIIRATVGDSVLLDKDGSPMLTPVGIADMGRISQDTGHLYEATRGAATGIAARYYMHRNFFDADPDAFTVSQQVIADGHWHANQTPLSLDEAETSIALSAVSGGMFEIGDDLPALSASPDRLALVRTPTLIDMARLGRASVPLDLMDYRPQDRQPSIFLLQEDRRQAILTVFNWTDSPLRRSLDLNRLGLSARLTASDALHGRQIVIVNGHLNLEQPPHSVYILKLIDRTQATPQLAFQLDAPTSTKSGQSIQFTAVSEPSSGHILEFQWQFGDGVRAQGSTIQHTYTQPGTYSVIVTAIGIEGRTRAKQAKICVTEYPPTIFNPGKTMR